MPFEDEMFDYVFSFGVLMHTGNTREAIKQAARVLKYQGHLNFWIYASEPIPYEADEPEREVKSFFVYLKTFIVFGIAWLWIHTFRKMPHNWVVRIVRFFSSDFWYTVNKIPLIGKITRVIFNPSNYPDFDYRFINVYDGWVNRWSDTWNEHEIFPVLKASDIVIQGISDWRLGIWGIKLKDFYQ